MSFYLLVLLSELQSPHEHDLSCIQNFKFSLIAKFTDTGAIVHIFTAESTVELTPRSRDLLTKHSTPVFRHQINLLYKVLPQQLR